MAHEPTTSNLMPSSSKAQARWLKIAWLALLTAGALYLLLLIPDSASTPPASGTKQPFVWNLDEYWNML